LVGAQNTALLRAIPGLGELGKFLLGPAAEQVMLLENIGTSVLVSDNQLADLHRLMEEAAGILDLEAPELYVRQNPVPNAYTLAIAGRKPFVVIHTSLVELLTPAELQVCLEHPTRHLLSQKKIPFQTLLNFWLKSWEQVCVYNHKCLDSFAEHPKSI
jgi:hypothetical protein